MSERRRTGSRGVPALVAVAILAVLGGGWWLTRPDSAAAPGAAGPSGPVTGIGSSPGPIRRHDPLAVTVTDYYPLDATHLSVGYAMGLPACAGVLATPDVRETSRAVTITLHRIPVPVAPRTACPELAILRTTVITLQAPVGHRAVRDGSTGAQVRRGRTPGVATPLN